MGEAVQVLQVHLDHLQHFSRLLLGFASGHPVDDHGAHDGALHRLSGIQVRRRVLEHDGDLPVQLFHVLMRRFAQVDPVDHGFAAGHLRQGQQHPGQGRLAGAGFTDETDDLALLHGERNVVHGLHLLVRRLEQTLGDLEIFLHVAHFDHGCAHSAASFPSACSSSRKQRHLCSSLTWISGGVLSLHFSMA